jgi:hypothetical protein
MTWLPFSKSLFRLLVITQPKKERHFVIAHQLHEFKCRKIYRIIIFNVRCEYLTEITEGNLNYIPASQYIESPGASLIHINIANR